MIRCIELCKSYDGIQLIEKMNCSFSDRGFYLLLGESGSGKTTFLNILAGNISFDSGEICWNNRRHKGQVLGEEAEYITQDCFFVEFLTVMDNLRILGVMDSEIQQCLERFGLGDKQNQYPGTLSGGEKQRLALVRALLKKRNIFFLDEPTAALDEENKIKLFQMLQSLSREVLIICATHDREAMEYADRCCIFQKTSAGERRWNSFRTENVSSIPIYLRGKNAVTTEQCRLTCLCI